jgi:hypothetical protein
LTLKAPYKLEPPTIPARFIAAKRGLHGQEKDPEYAGQWHLSLCF